MPPSGMSQPVLLYQDNTQLVRLIGLQDQQGNFVNDSTNMTATVLDQNRTVVQPGVAMPYIAASNGDYEGLISVTFTPTVGNNYILVIDGDAVGGSSHIHLELKTEIRVRDV